MKKSLAKTSAKLLLLLALLLLLLPSLLRVLDGNVYLVGEESYYHVRIAGQIAGQGIPAKDVFVLHEREYSINPYHLLLSAFALIFSALTASKLVPFLLGLLCVYLFYLVLASLKVSPWTRVAATAILILSPVFIYAFNVSGPAGFILVLNLAGLLFLMRPGKLNALLSLLFFCIAATQGISHALASLLIVVCYSFSYRKKLQKGYLVIAAILIVLLSYSLPAYLSGENVDFVETNLVSSFFSDLGGGAGFSVFAVLLALVGYLLVWPYKKKYYFLYAFSLLLLACSFFYSAWIIYSAVIVAFLAGTAFVYFASMKWSLKILREFTLLVLFCGLLFSAFAAVFSLQEALPNTQLVNSLVWLKLNSEEGDVVFSHYSNGFWIEAVSKRPVVMDGLLRSTQEVDDLYYDSMQIFETDDLDKARDLLSKYGIRYVVITKNMYGGLVWEKPEQGLDFLLTNAETFKKVHENSYVRIYEYVPAGVER